MRARRAERDARLRRLGAELGRIVAAQQPELRPIAQLADSLNVRTDGSRITIKIRYDANELLQHVATLIDEDDDDWDDEDDAWDDEDEDEWDDHEDDDRQHGRRHERKRRKRSRDDS